MNIEIDFRRDRYLSEFSIKTLQDRYLVGGEGSPQQAFARAAEAFADDEAHAQRLYDYASKLWFMFSTPILSNGGTKRGLPISCFLNYVDDSRLGITGHYTENAFLSSVGGGVGGYWGDVRSVGSKTSAGSESTGVIPFIKVVDANTTNVDELKTITEEMERQSMEGVDEDFLEGPPCLALISKISNQPTFDGKDRFMYNFHVFVKMKYPDTWEQKVKNAPVKYFAREHANAWDDNKLKQKTRSWNRSEKGYTCNQSPISDFCKKGICVKKKFGILAGSKGQYPVLTNLRKIDIEPDPEYEFDVTKPDGIGKATVHCKTIEHVTDQRKRRNSIAKAAGFPPPIIKAPEDQTVLEALFQTQKIINPPVGTSPKEKLHDVLHAKINGPKAMNDASFKSGTVLIEDGYAYFKFDKFYDKLKSKNWKHGEDKTGVMMKTNYKHCDIQFLEQKRYPTTEKGKYNTPTKNIVCISIEQFEDVKINHNKLLHNTEIM